MQTLSGQGGSVPAVNRPAALDRRRGPADRRLTPRGGRRATDLVRTGVLAALCALWFSPMASAAEPVRFGFDANSIVRARSLGMPVAYGSLWAGAWNQERYGWGGIRTQLETAKASGVTPVIQWWYWGDDLSPTCVDSGCRDQHHGVWKDKATWDRLTRELADIIVSVLGPNSGAIIIVETEFNKGSMQSNETFDGWLEEKAHFFHGKGLKVVVGFGNWGRSNWINYDRAVAAADLIGVMALQSSVRDSLTYLSGAEMLVSAARYNQAQFGKPSFVTDFAFSSYPEPSYEVYQDTVVREIFSRMDELRDAGVQGMVWRMLTDDPNFDTANYHGTAERHWGLLHADGTPKPAFLPFLIGMLAQRDETTGAFSDDPLPAGTAVKAVHLSELRARIDALRREFDLPAANWADPTITPGVTLAKAQHLREPQSAVAEVYRTAGLTPPPFTALPAQSTIRAAHVSELRAAVATLEARQSRQTPDRQMSAAVR
jgi:hypothetical protein